MTQAEWLASEDPERMLSFLLGDGSHYAVTHEYGRHPAATDRKLRLFACAAVRQVWEWMTDDAVCTGCYQLWEKSPWPEVGGWATRACSRCRGTGRVNRSRWAVEVAERFADGEATEIDLAVARQEAYAARLAIGYERRGMSTPQHLAHVVTADDVNSITVVFRRDDPEALVPCARLAHLLRDIIHPYRPAVCTPGPCEHCKGYGCCRCISWLTPTVRGLAEASYRERLQNGLLDPDRLAVLADCLEDAGCNDDVLLRHLRGEEPVLREMPRQTQTVAPPIFKLIGWRPLRGPHARGCFAVDYVLQKR